MDVSIAVCDAITSLLTFKLLFIVEAVFIVWFRPLEVDVKNRDRDGVGCGFIVGAEDGAVGVPREKKKPPLDFVGVMNFFSEIGRFSGGTATAAAAAAARCCLLIDDERKSR